jgi:hypothetical protein
MLPVRLTPSRPPSGRSPPSHRTLVRVAVAFSLLFALWRTCAVHVLGTHKNHNLPIGAVGHTPGEWGALWVSFRENHGSRVPSGPLLLQIVDFVYEFIVFQLMFPFPSGIHCISIGNS